MASVDVFVDALARLRTQRGPPDHPGGDALRRPPAPRPARDADRRTIRWLSGRAVEFLSGEDGARPLPPPDRATLAAKRRTNRESDRWRGGAGDSRRHRRRPRAPDRSGRWPGDRRRHRAHRHPGIDLRGPGHPEPRPGTARRAPQIPARNRGGGRVRSPVQALRPERRRRHGDRQRPREPATNSCRS